MKVKTLLKTLDSVDYLIISPTGYSLESGFIHGGYLAGESLYEDAKVGKISIPSDDVAQYGNKIYIYLAS